MSHQIAVVGAGRWGVNLVRNFAALEALRVVCDADSARLARLKAQYPGLGTSKAYEDILSDTAIQAAVIATPAASHYTHAKAAMAAGKDVFVEKPLALTVEDGRSLVALAEQSQRILMIGRLLRYHPGILRLKELVDDGNLGKIQYVYSNRLNR